MDDKKFLEFVQTVMPWQKEIAYILLRVFPKTNKTYIIIQPKDQEIVEELSVTFNGPAFEVAMSVARVLSEQSGSYVCPWLGVAFGYTVVNGNLLDE